MGLSHSCNAYNYRQRTVVGRLGEIPIFNKLEKNISIQHGVQHMVWPGMNGLASAVATGTARFSAFGGPTTRRTEVGRASWRGKREGGGCDSEGGTKVGHAGVQILPQLLDLGLLCGILNVWTGPVQSGDMAKDDAMTTRSEVFPFISWVIGVAHY